jgi:RHS repeat-associated protein
VPDTFVTAPSTIDQRYYASSYGRFNTADPYQASAGPSDPGSWNRYSYTRGDPVNRKDPSGRFDCAAYDEYLAGLYGWVENSACDADELNFCDSQAAINAFEGTGDFGCNTLDDGAVMGQAASNGPSSSVCRDGVLSKTSTCYMNPHHSGNDWNRLTQQLKSIDRSLKKDPKCEKLLTSEGVTMTTINGYLLNPIGTFTMADNIVTAAGAVFAGSTNDLSPGMVINSSAYMKSDALNDALTILHELAHFTGVFPAENIAGNPSSLAGC